MSGWFPPFHELDKSIFPPPSIYLSFYALDVQTVDVFLCGCVSRTMLNKWQTKHEIVSSDCLFAGKDMEAPEFVLRVQGVQKVDASPQNYQYAEVPYQ